MKSEFIVLSSEFAFILNMIKFLHDSNAPSRISEVYSGNTNILIHVDLKAYLSINWELRINFKCNIF